MDVKGFSLGFGDGGYLPVKGLDLALHRGEVAGLVGESGSGKSLTAFGLMGILPYGAKVRSGELLFDGEDVLKLDPVRRRSLCGERMGMIFQEPMSALNPVLTIGEQVSEIFRYRLGMGGKEARAGSLRLLSQVGLPNPKNAYGSYPHRFSGGMRQRVVIAMALALNPDLVIADEPTTALDPTIARQILRLLKDMTSDRNTSVLFITHNLRMLIGLSRRIFVMYAGLILEETMHGLDSPLHPYTRGLVEALPPPPSAKRPSRCMTPIPGSAPSPSDILPGCPFAPRCPDRFDPCEKSLPALFSLKGGQKARCFKYADA
jgi:peptide/nickel transport system ATP-binding protein/oligopeptide transport system ATP-binding protein